MTWLVWSLLSAIFAAATAILAKLGVTNVNPNLATAVRKRNFSNDDVPRGDTSMFVDANVLMNVKADEYVAVFALSVEGETVPEANNKMSALVHQFTDGLRALGIKDADIYTDFVTEPKIFGYKIANKVATEQLVGVQLNKNVSVHYTSRDLLDPITVAAANAQIYDLIKVNYVVKDIDAVQTQLMEEASSVVSSRCGNGARRRHSTSTRWMETGSTRW